MPVNMVSRRSSGTRYEYHSVTIGDGVEITVTYYDDKLFPSLRKGIYIGIAPIRLERRDGYVTKTFIAYSGFRFLVKELKRFNRKQLAAIAETVDNVVIQAAEAFAAGNEAEAVRLIKRELGLLQNESAA